MPAYIARRIAIAVPLLVAVLFASFSLLYLLPGDPTHVLLGQHWTEEAAERIRVEEGLNDPLHVQFSRYLRDLVIHGDLGTDLQKNAVDKQIATRLPATIELGVFAMIIASIVGVTAGVISATQPRGWRDLFVLSGALAGVSIPIFWLALIAQRLFRTDGIVADTLGWDSGLPLGGRLSESFAQQIDQAILQAQVLSDGPLNATGFLVIDSLFVFRDPAMFGDVLLHLLLPAIVLSTVPTAMITRVTRAAVGEELGKDYMRTAIAKGVRFRHVITRHVLRNAAIPIVTSIGTQLGYLMGGAVLTETIFNWPGMGTFIVNAILQEDVRPLQAGVLVIASAFIVINLLVDISYAWLDPRVRMVAE